MIVTLHALLLIVALICFVLATISWPSIRLNLIAAGLALWLLATQILA